MLFQITVQVVFFLKNKKTLNLYRDLKQVASIFAE